MKRTVIKQLGIRTCRFQSRRSRSDGGMSSLTWRCVRIISCYSTRASDPGNIWCRVCHSECRVLQRRCWNDSRIGRHPVRCITGMGVRNMHAAQMGVSFDTYIPVCRTWWTTVFAFVHLSSRFPILQASNVATILSMISCFLPDLEKCVLHSSLRPARICFSLSTVLFLMLWRICLKHYSGMLQ